METTLNQETVDFLGQRLLRDILEYLMGKMMTERISRNYFDAFVIVNTISLYRIPH